MPGKYAQPKKKKSKSMMNGRNQEVSKNPKSKKKGKSI